MYGARCRPIAIDTARCSASAVSSASGASRAKLDAVHRDGTARSSTVALSARSPRSSSGHPGLGRGLNIAQSFSGTARLHALAIAVGFLGLVVHLVMTALERRLLAGIRLRSRARHDRRTYRIVAVRSRSCRSRSSSPGNLDQIARRHAEVPASRRSSCSSATSGSSNSSAPTSPSLGGSAAICTQLDHRCHPRRPARLARTFRRIALPHRILAGDAAAGCCRSPLSSTRSATRRR